MRKNSWPRSILAILVGYFVMVALVAALFAALPQDPSFFASPYILFSLIGAGLLAAFGGGYVTAWFVKGEELPHAGMLAGLVFLFGMISAVATPGGEAGPLWFQLSTVLAGMVGALAGGYWRALHTRPDIKLFHIAHASDEEFLDRGGKR